MASRNYFERSWKTPWNRARIPVERPDGSRFYEEPNRLLSPGGGAGFDPEALDLEWDETTGAYRHIDPIKRRQEEGNSGGAYRTFGRVAAPESTADLSEGQSPLPATSQSLAALRRLIAR